MDTVLYRFGTRAPRSKNQQTQTDNVPRSRRVSGTSTKSSDSNNNGDLVSQLRDAQRTYALAKQKLAEEQLAKDRAEKDLQAQAQQHAANMTRAQEQEEKLKRRLASERSDAVRYRESELEATRDRRAKVKEAKQLQIELDKAKENVRERNSRITSMEDYLARAGLRLKEVQEQAAANLQSEQKRLANYKKTVQSDATRKRVSSTLAQRSRDEVIEQARQNRNNAIEQAQKTEARLQQAQQNLRERNARIEELQAQAQASRRSVRNGETQATYQGNNTSADTIRQLQDELAKQKAELDGRLQEQRVQHQRNSQEQRIAEDKQKSQHAKNMRECEQRLRQLQNELRAFQPDSPNSVNRAFQLDSADSINRAFQPDSASNINRTMESNEEKPQGSGVAGSAASALRALGGAVGAVVDGIRWITTSGNTTGVQPIPNRRNINAAQNRGFNTVKPTDPRISATIAELRTSTSLTSTPARDRPASTVPIEAVSAQPITPPVPNVPVMSDAPPEVPTTLISVPSGYVAPTLRRRPAPKPVPPKKAPKKQDKGKQPAVVPEPVPKYQIRQQLLDRFVGLPGPSSIPQNTKAQIEDALGVERGRLHSYFAMRQAERNRAAHQRVLEQQRSAEQRLAEQERSEQIVENILNRNVFQNSNPKPWPNDPKF